MLDDVPYTCMPDYIYGIGSSVCMCVRVLLECTAKVSENITDVPPTVQGYMHARMQRLKTSQNVRFCVTTAGLQGLLPTEMVSWLAWEIECVQVGHWHW